MPNLPFVTRRKTEHRGLSQEITIALSIKIILLTLLWFAVFRPGASGPRQDSAAALFAPIASPSAP